MLRELWMGRWMFMLILCGFCAVCVYACRQEMFGDQGASLGGWVVRSMILLLMPFDAARVGLWGVPM